MNTDPLIGILDYGMGNIQSVVNAFSALEHPHRLLNSPDRPHRECAAF